jgi:hypothetical protein
VLLSTIAETWIRCGETWGIPGGVTVLVLRAPDRYADLRHNSERLVLAKPIPCSALASPSGEEQLQAGMSYSDARSGLVVRCVRSGSGQLSIDGRLLVADPAAGGTPVARCARR